MKNRIKWLIRLSVRSLKKLDRMGTLNDVVAVLFFTHRAKRFKYVEIGVFKGDSVINVIRFAKGFRIGVFYVGFDLFEDQEKFYKFHPAERAKYDSTKEDPYWEFTSGQHALNVVKSRIQLLLAENDFRLVRGDSTITVPLNRDLICDADLIFIDGCHEYDIVHQDWMNIAPLFLSNPSLVVVFDDNTSTGVYRVRMEIEAIGAYRIVDLNFNQFIVISHKAPCLDQQFFRAIGWLLRS